MVTTDGHRLSKVDVKVTGRQAIGDDADPAQGHPRAPPPVRRDAREGATATGSTKLELIAERLERVLPGRGHDVQREARRRAVPALLAGHPAEHATQVVGAASAPGRRAEGRLGRRERAHRRREAHASPNGSMRITSESPESGDGFDEIPVEYAGTEHEHRLQREVLPRRARSDRPTKRSCSASRGELDPARAAPAARTMTSDRAVPRGRHADAHLNDGCSSTGAPAARTFRNLRSRSISTGAALQRRSRATTARARRTCSRRSTSWRRRRRASAPKPEARSSARGRGARAASTRPLRTSRIERVQSVG